MNTNQNEVIDREELLEEVNDIIAKFQDIQQTLEANKELDFTQLSFLKMYNV